MTHIAIAEALDGKVVDWMEHVSDAQYRTWSRRTTCTAACWLPRESGRSVAH
jgi:hypothetical protein